MLSRVPRAEGWETRRGHASSSPHDTLQHVFPSRMSSITSHEQHALAGSVIPGRERAWLCHRMTGSEHATGL